MDRRGLWNLLDPRDRWFIVVLAFGIPLMFIDFTRLMFDPVWLRAIRYTLTAFFLLHVVRGAWKYRPRRALRAQR